MSTALGMRKAIKVPTTRLEVTGINCHIARAIVNGGVDQLRSQFSDDLSLNFDCIVNGRIVNSTTYGIRDSSLGWEILVEVGGLYIICGTALFAAWYYLFRRGASARDFFYWGALALIVPFIGPIVTMIMYRFTARNDG